MQECSAIDLLPKSGQVFSCYFVSTHNVVKYEAFDKRLHGKIVTPTVSLTRNVDTYYRELYDKNYGGHLVLIRFAQKLRWTLISLDIYYIQPFW